MTEPPQNIDTLQNEETLHISKEKTRKLSKLTNGYAFAYQVLWYLSFKNPDMEEEKIIERFDALLNEKSYEIIWSELSEK